MMKAVLAVCAANLFPQCYLGRVITGLSNGLRAPRLYLTRTHHANSQLWHSAHLNAAVFMQLDT